jgi:short-subunit dehydrogenase
MTALLSGKGQKMADVESVAQAIVQGVANSNSVVFAPAKWGLIMMVIRHLPRFVFNKIDI